MNNLKNFNKLNLLIIVFIMAIMPVKLFSSFIIDEEVSGFRNIEDQVENGKLSESQEESLSFLELGFDESNANSFVKDSILVFRHYAILKSFNNYLFAIKDKEIKDKEFSKGGGAKFLKKLESFKNIDKFFDYVGSSLILTYYASKAQNEVGMLLDSVGIKLNDDGTVVLDGLWGKSNSFLVNEAVEQVSLFLEKYEFVYNSISQNPFLILMSDEELKAYKGEMDKVILEFSSFDYFHAWQEFLYAVLQYNSGMQLQIDKRKKEDIMQDLSIVLGLKRSVESVTEYQKKIPAVFKDESKSIISFPWMFYELLIKRNILNYFPGEHLNVESFIRVCQSSCPGLYTPNYLKGEAYGYLTGDYQCTDDKSLMDDKTFVEKCEPIFKEYCESIDLNKMMVRIDAFWKVWGNVYESGKDPWSYSLSPR